MSPPAPGLAPTLFDDATSRRRRRSAPSSAAVGAAGARAPDGGRLTLERRIARVWEGLTAAGVAECPVCTGRMRLADGVGRCGRCGSALS